MKNICLSILTVLILSTLNVCGQEINGEKISKAAADSAYIKGDFATAINIYEVLLKTGEAAEIYYNLGNSYYKSDSIAKAIVNYERALLLKPNNSDIRANLEIARAKTVDKVVPVPEIFFVTWINALINCLNINVWARIGIASFILFLASLFVFFFTKRTAFKKYSFITSIIFLILTATSNIFASQLKERMTQRNEAIILSASVTVRSTPSKDGTSLFILHEGRKVSITDDSMRDWKEITLENGKVGWVPSASIELI